MPLISPLFDNVTTINYTLEWPHLENPSNTTFAGPTQIDICRCGGKNIDLEHIYTRYRCPRPKVRFTSPGEELWVLQAPLGQVNLLRPANEEEIQRSEEIGATAEPSAYAGKIFLLLTGPCPRGRYQAYATLQYLRSLPAAARHNVEYLSLLIQPYEEDCSDDQGGRAYIELARYILEEVPAFKSLYLNIWGEETRIGAREFAMLLWRDGVTIVVNWDWWGESSEEYTEINSFLHGIETGMVARGPVWEDARQGEQEEEKEEDRSTVLGEGAVRLRTLASRLEGQKKAGNRKEKANVIWREVTEDDDNDDEEEAGNGSTSTEDEGSEHDDEDNDDDEHNSEEGVSPGDELVDADEDATTPTRETETTSSEDDWSDALMTPLSPEGKSVTEDSGWQVL